MQFFAIDVETANADLASICAVGAVEFVDGQPAREWYSLVDPRDYFHGINVGIHGICKADVLGAPAFPEAFQALLSLSGSGLAVSHTAFDRVAIGRALAKYGLCNWSVSWLDSCRVARRAWPHQCAESGYGLAAVAAYLGIEFKHHHALEDARAAGLILCRAIEATGMGLDEWPRRISQPVSADGQWHRFPPPVRLQGDPDCPFSGEKIAFTGALRVARHDAAEMAAHVGFDVLPNVTKKVTVLVVGDQDARMLAGHEISSKHRKAEALIQAGHNIQIITEADFFDLVSDHSSVG